MTDRPSERRGRSPRAALLLAALTVLLACGPDPDDSIDLQSRTVGVRASGCSLVDALGSGVVVDLDTVVTVAHTIAGSTAISVETDDGRSLAATAALFDPESDIAVIVVDGLGGTPMSLAGARSGQPATVARWVPDLGTSVAETSVTRLLLVTIENIYLEGRVQRTAFEIEAPVEPGASGGPVFSWTGELLGIVYAASRQRDGVGFALDHREIAGALASPIGAPVDVGRCR